MTHSAVDQQGQGVATRAGESQWRALLADRARYVEHGAPWRSEGYWASCVYRLQKLAQKGEPRWLWLPVRVALLVVRRVLAAITHINLDPRMDIGPGLWLPHPGAIWISERATIGAGCTIYQGCTIGRGPSGLSATLGDHVEVCTNASIIGNVTIGNNAVIAANSLVIADVPAGATAIGVPAKIIPKMWTTTR